jgi:hypothetical protein
VTILKAKKPKQAKKYENSKSSIPKIDQKTPVIEQVKHQVDVERIQIDRKRKSYRGDLRAKKNEVASPANMNSTTNSVLGQSKAAGLGNSRNGSKVFRHTDTLFSPNRNASNSSNSIRGFLEEDYVDEDSELEVVITPHLSPSINTIHEKTNSHLTIQEDPQEDTTNTFKRSPLNKERVTFSHIKRVK